jgi:probable phosphoglycerate mutase
VEASFALAFGLGASANRVDCAPLNTSLTHWRHRAVPAGEPEWTLISFNDADHLNSSAPPASPRHGAVPLPDEGPAADV